jgi:hypothetical protein
VNFLLHRHLAARALGSTVAGHGAMLPDLWRMADRRVRASHDPETLAAPAGADPVDEEVAAGIEHHLRADRWFHASALFLDGERRCAERFREQDLAAPRMGLLAHASWELCLDGALVRRQGLAAVVGALAEGFAAAGPEPPLRAARRHHFARVARTPADEAAFSARMRGIGERLLEGTWIAAYGDGAGLCRVIDGMRRRLGLAPLGDRDRPRLAHAFDALAVDADAVLDDLLASAP